MVRRRMHVGPRAALVLGAVLAGVPARAEERPRLAVMSLQVEEGVSASVARLLNELILSEIGKRGVFDVVGEADIKAMIGFEEQRQLAGCSNEDCLAEIGGALGVERVVFGNIGRVGEHHLINLKLVNVSTTQVESRWSGRVEQGEGALLDAIPVGIATLFARFVSQEVAPAAPPAAGNPRRMIAERAETAPTGEPEDSILGAWWLWAAVGAAAAAGVGVAIAASGGGSAPDMPGSVGVQLGVPLP